MSASLLLMRGDAFFLLCKAGALPMAVNAAFLSEDSQLPAEKLW